NLLTVVVGNTYMVRDRLPPASPLQDMLGQIESIGHCIADLARQVLLYAQQSRAWPEPVSLPHLITEIADQLSASASPKVIVRYDVTADLPDVTADPAQMRRLITSLFLNAAEAIGDAPGVIVVHAHAVAADWAFLAATQPARDLAEGRYVLLQISDTGCGMD